MFYLIRENLLNYFYICKTSQKSIPTNYIKNTRKIHFNLKKSYIYMYFFSALFIYRNMNFEI